MKIYNTAYPYFPQEDIENILIDIRDVLEGKEMLTMGNSVQKFEENFKNYCDTKYAVAVNSCTSALEISMAALELTSEDEVIVPVQTFVATGSSVLKSGAKLVFCDVDDNFLLDFKSLKKVITKKTKAVIVVHFAGMISEDIFKIKQYLQDRSIALIEDSAHAHGAHINGIKAGSIGDFGCFSFYSTKIMTTGEGGMITTNNKKYYEKCASIRSRGIDINSKTELFINLGSNHRVTEIQAILGCYQLNRLTKFSSHRNKIANIYKTKLKEFINLGKIRLQNASQDNKHAYWRFIVFIEDGNRNKIKKILNSKGIKADAPYSPLLHEQPLFSNIEKDVYTNGKKLSEKHISLPIHMLISEDDAEFISNTLIECLND